MRQIVETRRENHYLQSIKTRKNVDCNHLNVWYQINLYVLLQNMKHTIRIDAVLYCLTCWYASIRCVCRYLLTIYTVTLWMDLSLLVIVKALYKRLISSLDGVRVPLDFVWCALCMHLARFFSAYQQLELNCPIKCSSSSLVYLWGGHWTGNFSRCLELGCARNIEIKRVWEIVNY